MDLRLNDFQRLLTAAAEDFLTREVPAEKVRATEAAGEPDAELWAQMVGLGWTGLPIAETYGGQGATILEQGLLAEQLCRAAVLAPYTQTMAAALTIQRWGGEALKRRWLPQVVEGRTLTPAFFNAGAGAPGRPPATWANGALSGAKGFVEYGRSTEMYLVAAEADGAPGLALVLRAQPGVSIRDLRSLGGTPQAAVRFNAAAAEEWIPGREAVDYLRLLSTAFAALEAYAYARKALDMTVDYAQMRVQFGRPIGTFGAVQSRCADMATQVHASRFLIYELLAHFDQDDVDPAQVAIVKAIASRMAPDVVMDAHLIHGGIGVMREYHLQFYSRRAKEAALRWAGLGECMNTVAAALTA